MKRICISLITIFLIQSCEIAPTDNEKKIIGTWTIEKVENLQPDSNLREGTLISFTKEKEIYYPRISKEDKGIGSWKLLIHNDSTYLEINSKNQNFNISYKLITPLNTPRPYQIKLDPVTKNKEIYFLARLEDDPNNFF